MFFVQKHLGHTHCVLWERQSRECVSDHEIPCKHSVQHRERGDWEYAISEEERENQREYKMNGTEMTTANPKLHI